MLKFSQSCLGRNICYITLLSWFFRGFFGFYTLGIKSLFQTCMSLFSLLNIKEDILKNVGNQTVSDLHWLFLLHFFSILWKSMGKKQLFGYPYSSKIFFHVQQKTDIHTGLEQPEVSKWWQNFHFWMNYPFNTPSSPHYEMPPTVWQIYIISFHPQDLPPA